MAGQRLDRFIQIQLPRLSRTRAQAIVRSCAYREDGTRRRPSDRVRWGETVLLVRPRFEEPEVPQAFDILYEDHAIVAIDKPAGLPMHPTATYHRNTLTYMLRQRFGDASPQIAHRLDRETSGVVLCGRGREYERALKIAFERREVRKTYLAITRGEIADDEGVIALPIAPVREGLHILMEIASAGVESVTEFRTVARCNGHSLVELSPKTGRQHQLRVHLSAIGHPIVGDKLYGPAREAPFLEYISHGMSPQLGARLGHHRQALHAHTLTFQHPARFEPMQLVAPFPQDLTDLWAGYRDAARFPLPNAGPSST